MEDYLFGFDINNPEWIAQRERAWISLEKEMKKRWQTQGPTQSQIKRIVNVKHNGSYESSKL